MGNYLKKTEFKQSWHYYFLMKSVENFHNKLNQVIHSVDYANTKFYSRRQKGVG